MRGFSVGDRVTLTENMRRVAAEPEKYKTGVVTKIGSFGIVDVLWNGLDHPIGMKSIEIVPA